MFPMCVFQIKKKMLYFFRNKESAQFQTQVLNVGTISFVPGLAATFNLEMPDFRSIHVVISLFSYITEEEETQKIRQTLWKVQLFIVKKRQEDKFFSPESLHGKTSNRKVMLEIQTIWAFLRLYVESFRSNLESLIPP